MGEPASAKIQQEANASVNIDIPKKEEREQPLLSLEACIYRVPYPLRKLNEEAYGPQVISIGPFHHGKKKLQTMEKYKTKYLEAFIERAKIKMEYLKHVVKGLEERVRQCYAESTTALRSDDFVTIILTDASFILELFFRNWLKEWTPDDSSLLKPWLAARMQLDFILLENQLPFFIFEELFKLAVPSEPAGPTSFIELCFDYFQFYNRQNMSPRTELKILHFVDLLRNSYLPPARPLPERVDKIVEHMYTATQLDGVGLKFEVDLSSNCLLDLQLDYKKRVLKISRFTFDNDTELYVRNLLALEQCHYPNKTYITDYFILLDFLINDKQDVDLLRQQRIVVSGFDSKHATNFINNLCTSISYPTVSRKYYDICIKLKEFYEKPGWLEYMRRNYFSTTLWQAASIVTILTFIQTVCSIISVLPHH